jgi:hypothetical protein
LVLYRYEQVWDWKKAEASGKLEFCMRVAPNKKAEAYEKLYQRGFTLPGFYQEVCGTATTDGSDWTEDNKKRFRASLFKEQKSIIKVSKTIGKPMKECMGYYYGSFKKSKDYPRLKLAIYRHKQQAVKTRSGNWICDTCGIGGKLIACDSCEAHFHLTCLEPPLKEVPEGSWICDSCLTKTDDKPVVKEDVVNSMQICSLDKPSADETKNDTSQHEVLISASTQASKLKVTAQTTQGNGSVMTKTEETTYLNLHPDPSKEDNDIKISTNSTTKEGMSIRSVDSDMYEDAC